MSSVESTGSGSTVGSSSSVSLAAAEPSGFETEEILLTTPMRAPPIRTSFPRTRPAALGTSASSE